MDAVTRVIELYLLLVALDVLVGWVQLDPARWPRRGLHVLTEGPQALLRRAVRPAWLGGWDISPLLVIGLLGGIRVWLVACF